MKRYLILTLLLLFSITALAQDAGTLTLDRIFASDDFQGDYFGGARWLSDGSGYSTLQRVGKAGVNIIKVDPITGDSEILVPAKELTPTGAQTALGVADYQWSADGSKMIIFTNTRRVWRRNSRGDYWVLNLKTKSLKQLGADFEPTWLMFAKFSPDATKVAYVMKNNLYVENLSDNAITQISKDGSENIINGTFDWVYEEEFDCRDGFRWSPDGKMIAYWQLDKTGVRDFMMINNTDDTYSKIIPVQYPKAGETNSSAKVGVVSVAGGETNWFELEGDLRQHYIARMEWAGNSQDVVFQRLNRHQNRLWVMLGNAATGAVRTIHTEEETAWVDVTNDMRWFDDGQRYLWVTESDGWRHVYVNDRDGKSSKLITPWPFDVISIEAVDFAGGWLYYIATPDNPTQRYLYRSRINGEGEAERLSPMDLPGNHSYQISQNGKYAIHRYSNFNLPTTTDLVQLPDHSTLRVLAGNEGMKKAVAAIDHQPVEFFRVTIEDGVELDGFMMKPADFDPAKEYPVLFYAYTEPWGQTVQDSWGGRNFLWHTLLTQKGYIVMSIDNRGTPCPRGREWRKSIYGKMGRLNPSDQAAGVREVIKNYDFVDADRIGIWGWSGGGSASLNAMFRYPDLYSTGMAVAPVGSLRLYDTIYQERYTGLPQESPDNYDLGSPVNYAHQLEGNLLIVHGTGDDNVHFQNSEIVINKLIEHNLPFTMMAYPNRSHGIYEGKNTSRHVFELLTRYLLANLEPGGK
jgi:dipeptidyl-peptidase-4